MTSEVRGRSREDPMPERWQPRGVTPRPRSGARPRVPGCNGAGTVEKSYPSPRSGAAAGRSYPTSEVWGSSREELPYTRGQGRQLEGRTPRPRTGGCKGAGRPREAIPHWRSGWAAVRRYPSSKVRSSGCSLLEQPWRDTSKVRETQVRRGRHWERPSEGRQTETTITDN